MNFNVQKRTVAIFAVVALTAGMLGIFAAQTFAAAGSSSYNLTTLGKSAGKMTPVFSPTVTAYDIVVEYADGEDFTLKPKTNLTGATFTVNGDSVYRASETSVPITLYAGYPTTVVITVYSSSKALGLTYTINIKRLTPYTIQENPTDDWVFYDEFKDVSTTTIGGPDTPYFNAGFASDTFRWVEGSGLAGEGGMRGYYSKNKVGGGMQLSFGKTNETGSSRSKIQPDTVFKEIYVRWYLRASRNWLFCGKGAKMARITALSNNNWAQPFIVHLWGVNNQDTQLCIDPASGIATDGWTLATKGYNDFNNLRWLGYKTGPLPIQDNDHIGEWYCIEMHVKLNDPGQSNGIMEYWVDDVLQERNDKLNLIGNWNPGVDTEATHVGINKFFLEHYSNNNADILPVGHTQSRDYDQLVVSTKKIGPVTYVYEEPGTPPPSATPADSPTATTCTSPTLTTTPDVSETASTEPSPTATGSPLRGDATLDNIVNIYDIMEIRDHIFGTKTLAGQAFINADVAAQLDVLNIYDIMGIRDIIFGVDLE